MAADGEPGAGSNTDAVLETFQNWLSTNGVHVDYDYVQVHNVFVRDVNVRETQTDKNILQYGNNCKPSITNDKFFLCFSSTVH